MPSQKPTRLTLLIVVCIAFCTIGVAEPPSKEAQKGQFLRLRKTDDGSPVALEAAIVRFAPKDSGEADFSVDLISAVHVAEASYYSQLNRRFEQYDVVLYELVAPEGTNVPKGGPRGSGGSAVSMLQGFMTNVLELEFQLRGIDYTKDNLVHADMSPEQFGESMRRRGESVLQTFFRMMGYAMARQASDPAGSSDLRLLLAFLDKDRALAMKRVFAEQFEDLEGSLTAISGPEGSTLITERNKVALEVLRKQVAQDKKKIAIFYGAGHMFDFAGRLRDDFDLAPVSTEWLVAWDLKEPSQ
ncbi:MAG: hypothetical protein ACYTG0_12875 [Planctomycetota bacterium]|jgi:hypothetical protein